MSNQVHPISIKISRKQAKDIIKATFPEYTGQKIKVVFTERLAFHNLNWSGGTCNTYAGVNRNLQSRLFNAPAPWLNVIEGKSTSLPENGIIVCHSFFCGKDMGLTIYVHPCNTPMWLEA